MVGIILAPELGIAIAMHQNLQAGAGLRQLRGNKPEGNGSENVELKGDQMKVAGVGRDGLTKAHIFFANMGGFIARICVLPHPQQEITSSDNPNSVSSYPKMSQEFVYMISNYEDLGQSTCSQLLTYNLAQLYLLI